MIWVRALGVVGDTGTQVSERGPLIAPADSHETLQTTNGDFGNAEPTLGYNPHLPQSSLIGSTLTSGAVLTHPGLGSRLPPVIPPTVHCGVCGAIEVPQRPYRSAQLSTDPAYDNGEVIGFSQGGCGVSISDASDGRLSDLLGGEDLMFVDTNVSTFSVRIEVRISLAVQCAIH